MEQIAITKEKITAHAAALDKDRVSRILVLYEEKILFIGDFCVRFDKLKYFRSYFGGASIDINFSLKENKEVYEGLLTHNPNVDSFTCLSWDELSFDGYDVVFCAAYDEDKLLQYLHRRYHDAIASDAWRATVLSVSELLLHPAEFKRVFPVKEELMDYVRVRRPGEIYVAQEERAWADEWLQANGVRKDEQLYVVLDSTSRRSKLMNIHVYFELLKYFLSRKNVKLLIFDEKNIGKEAFYKEWLGPALSERLIFCKGMRLREALRILASSYTRLIFGPCTGLIHCASGIYNHYVKEGMPISQVPYIATYTGHYVKNEGNANMWWGASPLVNCLLIQEAGNKKSIVLLSSLPPQHRSTYTQVPSSEYTINMFTEFFDVHLAALRQPETVKAY